MLSRKTMCVAWLGMVLLAVNTAWASIIVRFEPATITIPQGSSAPVQIVADISEPIVGWGLDLTVTNPVVSLSGDPVLGPLWAAGSTPDGDGLAGLAFPNSISGTGILLATLNFEGVSVGETDLLLSITPGDLTEGCPLDPSGFAEITFQPGHITVPEPATLAMLTIAGVAAMRRRRR